VFVLEVLSEGLELGLRAGDEDEVETLSGKLRRELLAEAIGRSSDNSPGALLAVLAQL